MFEIKFLVEDNKLHKAMWALDGIAAEAPEVLPVRGAKATPTGVKSTTGNGTGLTDSVIALLQNEGGIATYTRIRDLYVQVGGHSLSASNLITRLLDRKVLKRLSKGNFAVLGTGSTRKKAASISGGYMADLNGNNLVAKVARLIKEQNISLLSITDLGDMSRHVGGSASSNYFISSQLMRQGMLVRQPDGNFQVVS